MGCLLSLLPRSLSFTPSFIVFSTRGRARCLHIYFPLWFLISSTHNRMILAKPFVVHSVIIFRLSFPSLGWIRRWADRLLPFWLRYEHPGGQAGCDGFLCHGNFIRPKAAPTPLHHASFSAPITDCEVAWSCFRGRDVFYEPHPFPVFLHLSALWKYWLSFHMLLCDFIGRDSKNTYNSALGKWDRPKMCWFYYFHVIGVRIPFHFQKLGESSVSGWDNETSVRALNA